MQKFNVCVATGRGKNVEHMRSEARKFAQTCGEVC